MRALSRPLVSPGDAALVVDSLVTVFFEVAGIDGRQGKIGQSISEVAGTEQISNRRYLLCIHERKFLTDREDGA